jgi:hypothetical protein
MSTRAEWQEVLLNYALIEQGMIVQRQMIAHLSGELDVRDLAALELTFESWFRLNP